MSSSYSGTSRFLDNTLYLKYQAALERTSRYAQKLESDRRRRYTRRPAKSKYYEVAQTAVGQGPCGRFLSWMWRAVSQQAEYSVRYLGDLGEGVPRQAEARPHVDISHFYVIMI